MGVTLIQVSQKYFNEFKNGTTFGDNPGDFTTNLAASIQENVKYLQQVDISWDSISNATDVFLIDDIALPTLIFTRAAGNWLTDGWWIDDTLDFIFFDVPTAGFINLPATVLSVDADNLVLDVPGWTVLHSADGEQIQLRGLEPLISLNFQFGLIGNTESYNSESKVSENDQGYYSATVGLGGPRSTVFQNMIRIGQYADWQTGSMRVRFVSNPSTYVQRFEIEHIFMVVPYYLDGELIDNLQANVIPDILDGNNSLKYAFKAGFRTANNNPNTQKTFISTNNLGSVGWYNESFNGFQNDYNIVSRTYEDEATTNTADGLLISVKTKTVITVERLSGVMSGAERFGVYVSYTPEQDEYQNKITNLKANFIYDRAFNNAGLAFTTGDDFITKCEAVINGSDQLVITLETEYSILQKTFLSTKLSQGSANFIVSVLVGDASLSSISSDRVNLLVDALPYDDSPDIPGLMTINKFDFFPHDRQEGVDTPSTDLTVWIEDNFLNAFNFKLNRFLAAVINTLEFKLVAYNTVTDQIFELDSYSYGVAQATISNNIQQLNENKTRGYILKSGDQFNKATINTGVFFAFEQNYDGVIGQKVSWQDWIQNLGVDTIFYDNTKLNDNFNLKASNYTTDDYEIRFGLFASVSGISGLQVPGTTIFSFLSPKITTFDYEEDGGFDIWSHVIETFDETGTTNLGGSILTGQNTLFRATWTKLVGGPVVSLVDIWGINRIEETNQPGYAITEMSSINDPAANQLLIPSVGTLLDLTIVGGKVVMECLIDGSVAIPGINYNLSTEIRDANTVMPEDKITEQGVPKDTEQGVQKIIE